ncbi:hypothetical protein GCM10011512_12800 [Tersicoccus solisilvae]|uniref:Gfo/Idh/MocA-like oxidoreductase N-terminal domain-containing protein n=1 Tax=Tersicoccus solisilvae TaxID=1882339 RepID=A0ABQ1NZ57_9MICC|nr:Gfo/Idh/MocA family oxidoreductase [Tersicoccus solisilvae]GGC87302.1 hypothetical protein GCM10011512_12800 [Tersicoccus solisilvae]
MDISPRASALADLDAVPRLSPREGGRSPLRALVRGSGSIGSRHARVLAGLGVEEVLVWPVRPGRPGVDRNLPAGARVVDSLPEGPLDLVVVATDTDRHVADTVDLLAAQPAAVLLEKPVSPTAESARPLLEHPNADRIVVSTPLRYHQGFALTAALLAELGTVTSAHVVSQSWLPGWRPQRDYRESYSASAAQGGVLRDLVHDIDYPMQLLGRPDALTAALGSDLLGIEAEEWAELLWLGAVPAHLRLDYITPVTSRGITLSTTSGTLRWDVPAARVELIPADGEPVAWSFPADRDVDTILARQTVAVLQRAGLEPPAAVSAFTPATLADGVDAVRICDAARASDRAGGRVRLGW